MVTDTVVKGKVVRFEGARGYGFIAPEGGGEDVFVHASELGADGQVACGTAVEFKVIEGERGLKAYDVRVLSAPAPQAPGERRPGPAPAAARAAGGSAPVGQEDTCEVLSEEEFIRQLTDLIMVASPSVTGGQIAEIRPALCDMARRHGWLE